jgi:hypothetical protein
VQYKIQQISEVKAPRSWKTRNGQGYTAYKVMLEGVDSPVEISIADDKAVVVGAAVDGELKNGEFGKSLVEWRPRKGGFQARDDDAIKAQWAIGQAVSLFIHGVDDKFTDIEKNAKDFFQMVDRVKQKEAHSPIDTVFPDSETITIPEGF